MASSEQLILVANPGSSSRKYALYKDGELLVDLHFEVEERKILCSVVHGEMIKQARIHVEDITKVAVQVFPVLDFYDIPINKSDISKIAVRVVAPGSYFQTHRLLDDKAVQQLKELKNSARLHITATLKEITSLSKILPEAKIVGISDSAFHSTMPETASNYAIDPKYAKELDIKRFGYHGISVGSVVNQLRGAKKLAERVIVCHLGSGASVTAVLRGKSVDTTMGYSPLEGLMMATRSGSIDPVAVWALRKDLGVSEDQIEDLLSSESGLLGVSGVSADLREVLHERRKGNKRATLAVRMYVRCIQQAIAQMSATLGGVDSVVFTGTVGERSAEIRSLVISKLLYLGLHLSATQNQRAISPTGPMDISSHGPISVFVVPASEDREMVRLAEIIR